MSSMCLSPGPLLGKRGKKPPAGRFARRDRGQKPAGARRCKLPLQGLGRVRAAKTRPRLGFCSPNGYDEKKGPGESITCSLYFLKKCAGPTEYTRPALRLASGLYTSLHWGYIQTSIAFQRVHGSLMGCPFAS